MGCYDQPVGSDRGIQPCRGLLTHKYDCFDVSSRRDKLREQKEQTDKSAHVNMARVSTENPILAGVVSSVISQQNRKMPSMSIRIIPQDQLEKSEKNPAETIPPLLFPRLKNLYSRRAARLRDLAAKNPLGDYLRFAAVIAQAQEIVLYDHPLQMNLHARLVQSNQEAKPPLDIHTLPRDTHWHRLLHSLIAELKPEMSGQALAVLENLEKASATELETMASALFAGEYAQVSSDKAPFIWAALSIYWAQMAALIPGKAQAEMGNQRQFCPVCNSMPVASMVHMGSHEGARYLHCNLCESEWYVVRSKCTNCEQSRDLHYWSLDSEHAAVKAESCGDCGSYLKMLYQEKNPAMEPVADDLASLVLDARMEQEGFARSSLNPFMFPGE
ncbi:Tat proofreading chaperone FdhE [Pantoea allii]|uniref:Protein FdhE homolog n=2 Tax=Erwiniaceae TaxID=1903409 RepID=A0A2V2BE10_9GAMM|nr:Tat proofreading chaperone FdhE [Pantoea allii]